MPIITDRKGALSIARRRKRRGGPSGERNGQYRHGERTQTAIAERRKFSRLLNMLREAVT